MMMMMMITGAQNPDEQRPCARVTAFSRTSLFLERLWREFSISFKFHKRVRKTYKPFFFFAL